MRPLPQLEDGYTRIANELYDAILLFPFSAREQKVVLTVMRKTYGYGKKEDDMSASQIGEMCGIARTHVTAVLNDLAAMQVLLKRPGPYGSIISINKNYSAWAAKVKAGKQGMRTSAESVQVDSTDSVLVAGGAGPDSGQVDRSAEDTSTDLVRGCTDSVLVPIQCVASTESVQVDSTDSVHTKENLPKENQQKKRTRGEIFFEDWVSGCKAAGEKPISEEDPIWRYADDVGLPIDFIRYCWFEFKRKYSSSRKKYTNWSQHFGNAVRENWYGVWYERDGVWLLTTRGKQIEKEQRAKQ